jgi:hypothetical protein
VKDMRAVAVNHRSGRGVAFGMTIAGDVRPGIEHLDLMSDASQFTCNDGAGKAGSHDRYRRHCDHLRFYCRTLFDRFGILCHANGGISANFCEELQVSSSRPCKGTPLV